jgi:hypothetical protein
VNDSEPQAETSPPPQEREAPSAAHAAKSARDDHSRTAATAASELHEPEYEIFKVGLCLCPSPKNLGSAATAARQSRWDNDAMFCLLHPSGKKRTKKHSIHNRPEKAATAAAAG